GSLQDERGWPGPGAIVSALGKTTSVAISDKLGRFELRTLTPGPYLVRAHLAGYVASRGQVIEVRSSARTSSSISLRRANVPTSDSLPVLAAGFGVPAAEHAPQPDDGVATTGAETGLDNNKDNHSEVAWRLRHARRGILKDIDIPDEILVGDTPPDTNVFGSGSILGSSARLASNFFSSTPFFGQVNLMTT